MPRFIRRCPIDLDALKQRAFQRRRSAMIEQLERRTLLSAGDLDTTFSGDGKVTTDLGTEERASEVIVQSDGKIVVAGAANGDGQLVRYNVDGTLDTSFSGDGIVRLGFSGGDNEEFNDVVLLPDGRILAAGNQSATKMWIARYTGSGQLDGSGGFGGGDGIYHANGQITEMELQGSSIITADSAGNVRRHSGSTGAVDSTFGSGGSVNVGAVTGMTNFLLNDLAMAPGSKIVVAGSADTSFHDGTIPSHAIARLNESGTADTTFAGDGSAVQVHERHFGRATGVVAQPDGKLVTIAEEADDHDAFILRVNIDGTPDTSFGSGSSGGPGSTVMFGYLGPPAAVPALAADLVLQSDGKIVVFGSQELIIEGDYTADFIVQRFTNSGLADDTFSGDSLTHADFTVQSWERARTGALGPDWKIVTAGETSESVNRHLALARFEGGDAAPSQSVYIQDRVLYVDGTAGNDTISTFGGTQSDPDVDVTLNGVAHSFHRDDFDRILVRGFAGDDSFSDRGISATFEGGDGNDSVYTEDDDDGVFATVFGGAGNDVVDFGADSGGVELAPFDGGTGRDKAILSLEGGYLDLRDHPNVEDGVLAAPYGTLTGNALDNHLTHLSMGRIYGGDGNDTLDGASRDGIMDLYGENGNDLLVGNAYDGDGHRYPPNTLDGGAGDDTLQAGTGFEVLKGGAGTDELTYASRTEGLRITLDDVANDGATGENDNVFSDIERIRGGAGNDWIDGNSAGNILYGLAGNDTLVGFGGNDALFGGDDNDRIYGGSGDDYIEGNAGNDTLHGEAGLDQLRGHDGDDWLYTRDGAPDTVDGGVGYDRADADAIDSIANVEEFLNDSGNGSVFVFNRILIIEGTAGNDTIALSRIGFEGAQVTVGINGREEVFNAVDLDGIRVFALAGDDSLDNGPGQTTPLTYLMAEGDDHAFNTDGQITIVGGAGHDRYDSPTRPPESFDGGDGSDSIDIHFGEQELDLNAFPTVENADIESGVLVGNDLNNFLNLTEEGTLMGGAGDDELSIDSNEGGLMDGGAGDDRLLAPSGFLGSQFTLRGGDGNDTLRGSVASDTLDGGAGNDSLVGNAGNDWLIPGYGSDVILGGDGFDYVNYAERTEDLSITRDGVANDGATGESDNVHSDVEFIFGGSGSDFISGTSGQGNAGNDTLRGSDGKSDELFGGDGNDDLDGGAFADALYGGEGDDTIKTFGDGDSVYAGNGNDTVNLHASGEAVVTLDGGLRTTDVDTFNIHSGSIAFNARQRTANPVLNIYNGAFVTFRETQHLHALNLAAGAAATMLANGDHYLFTRGLKIAGTAKLDLADNDLIWDYSGDSPYLTARDWVATGRAGTSGITSSTSTGKTVLALVDNAIYGRASWNGQEIDSTTLIGKYTYYGDANLDGKVTGDDYVAIDSNLGKTNAQWIHGDFNFDGRTSGDDYVSIDANLGMGTTDPASFDELQAEMITIHADSYGGKKYEKEVAQADRGKTRTKTPGRPAGRSPRG